MCAVGGLRCLIKKIRARRNGSPRLVQLTGTAMLAMLLLGPAFGIISDRYDRRCTIIVTYMGLAAMTYSASAAMALGVFPWWLIYPFCVLAGLANVLDTTNRPALVFDLLSNHGGARHLSTVRACAFRCI